VLAICAGEELMEASGDESGGAAKNSSEK